MILKNESHCGDRVRWNCQDGHEETVLSVRTGAYLEGFHVGAREWLLVICHWSVPSEQQHAYALHEAKVSYNTLGMIYAFCGEVCEVGVELWLEKSG